MIWSRCLCSNCGTKFEQIKNMKTHRVNAHYGVTYSKVHFPCVLCGALFGNKNSLNDHVKGAHSSMDNLMLVNIKKR